MTHLQSKYRFILIVLLYWNLTAMAQMQLDTSFDGDGKLEVAYFDYHEVVQMTVTSDSNMLILGLAGRITGNGFDYDFVLSKMDFDGNPITDFGVNGDLIGDFPGFDYSDISSVLELSDGSFILSGKGYAFSNSSLRPTMLMKVSSNGVIDTDFANNGVLEVEFLGETNLLGRMHLYEDKILLSAASQDTVDNSGYVAVVARFNNDFTLDTTFAGTGKIEVDVSAGAAPINAKVQHVSSGGFNDLSTDKDGNIYAVGYTLNSDRYGFMVKIKSDGTLDSAFSNEGMHAYLPSSTVKTNSALKIEMLRDSSHVIVFHTDNAQNDFALGHIGNNTFSSFEFDVDGNQDFLEEVLEDNLGRLYLIGRTIVNSNYNSAYYSDRYSIIRLNSDFTQDMTFGTNGVLSLEWGSGEQAGANVALLTDDNEIVLGGEVYGPSVSYINIGLVKLIDHSLTSVWNETFVDIKVYPNPARDQLNIDLPSNISLTKVQLISMDGDIENFYTNQLNLCSKPPGVYLINVITNAGIVSKKMVIE